MTDNLKPSADYAAGWRAAIEAAASIANMVMKREAEKTYRACEAHGASEQSAAKTYAAGEILEAIHALAPPEAHAAAFYTQRGALQARITNQRREIKRLEVVSETMHRLLVRASAERDKLLAEVKAEGIREFAEALEFSRNRLEMIASDRWNGDARDFKRSLVGVFAELDAILAAIQTPANGGEHD